MESLERLGLERVDIATSTTRTITLIRRSRRRCLRSPSFVGEGLVGAIGAGMTDATALARIVREFGPDCVLLAGQIHAARPDRRSMSCCRCASGRACPWSSGGFSTAASSRIRFRGRASTTWRRPRRCLTAHSDAAAVCASHDVPLPAAALQFALAHPAVVSVLTGVRSVAELVANVDHFDRELPPQLWDDLVTAGILPDAAPIPTGAGAAA